MFYYSIDELPVGQLLDLLENIVVDFCVHIMGEDDAALLIDNLIEPGEYGNDKSKPEEADGETAGVVAVAANITCQMAGMGILQLPYMLRQAGWVCLVLVVICAIATNHTGKPP